MDLNIPAIIESSVLMAMKAADIEDSPEARLKMYKLMHDELADQQPFGSTTNMFLLELEAQCDRLESAGY